MSALFSRQRKPEPKTPRPSDGAVVAESPRRESTAASEKGRWVLRPHQTEKASRLESEGVYTFIVDRRATKPAVRREIEARYRVKVRRVRIIQRRALVVRQGGRITRRRPAIKKALVTLEKGYRIEAESSS